jgi:hypothetical protein
VRRLLPAACAALVLMLGACGDDSGDDDVGRTQPAAAPPAGATGQAESRQQRNRDRGSDAPDVKLERDQEPVPGGSVLPEDRTGSPPVYTRDKPIPKAQLKAIERPVFEQSRYLCRRLGVDGMRREYRIDSTDPKDVARAVAATTYQREIRAAVFSGCLAGLRAGN